MTKSIAVTEKPSVYEILERLSKKNPNKTKVERKCCHDRTADVFEDTEIFKDGKAYFLKFGGYEVHRIWEEDSVVDYGKRTITWEAYTVRFTIHF